MALLLYALEARILLSDSPPLAIDPSLVQAVWCPNLQGDQNLTGTLSGDAPYSIWAIHPESPGPIALGLNSPDFDTQVGLYDQTGQRVCYGTSAVGGTATLTYAASTEDTYYVYAGSDASLAAGSYTLSINTPSFLPTAITLDPTSGIGLHAAPTPTLAHVRQLLFKDDFGDLTAWSGTGASLSADTTHARSGVQSMRFATIGSSTEIVRTLATPVDVSGASIRLMWYVPSAPDNTTLTSSAKLYVRLYSGAGGAGTWRENASFNAQLRFGWQTVEIPLSTFQGMDTGTDHWDPTQVTKIAVGWRNAPAGAVVALDELSLWKDQGPARLMWTFDNGVVWDYTKIAPALEAHGWRGAFAVVPSRVGTSGYMTLAQLQDLQARGHLIINNTYDRPSNWSNLTDAQRAAEVASGRQWLIDNGFTQGAGIVALPNGYFKDQADMDGFFQSSQVVLACGPTDRYGAVASTNGLLGWMPNPPGNSSVLWQYPINNAITTSMLDQLASGPYMGLALVEQNYPTDPPPSGYLTDAAFYNLLDYAGQLQSQGKLDVVSMGDYFYDGAISAPGDQNFYQFTTPVGVRSVAVTVSPTVAGLCPTVRLYGPDGTLLATAQAPAGGADATLNFAGVQDLTFLHGGRQRCRRLYRRV